MVIKLEWQYSSVNFSYLKETQADTNANKNWSITQKGSMVIRYKVYTEQHPRAGLNIQHVIYKQLARAGQITQPTKVGNVNYKWIQYIE